MKSKFKPGDVIRPLYWIAHDSFDRLVVCIDDEYVYYMAPTNELFSRPIRQVNEDFTLIHRPK